MQGFNWFKTKIDSAIAPIQQAPAQAESGETLEQKLTRLCDTPKTLGELSDLTGLTYRQLRPVLSQLTRDRKLKTLMLLSGSIHAIHYQTNNHEH